MTALNKIPRKMLCREECESQEKQNWNKANLHNWHFQWQFLFLNNYKNALFFNSKDKCRSKLWKNNSIPKDELKKWNLGKTFQNYVGGIQ